MSEFPSRRERERCKRLNIVLYQGRMRQGRRMSQDIQVSFKPDRYELLSPFLPLPFLYFSSPFLTVPYLFIPPISLIHLLVLPYNFLLLLPVLLLPQFYYLNRRFSSLCLHSLSLYPYLPPYMPLSLLFSSYISFFVPLLILSLFSLKNYLFLISSRNWMRYLHHFFLSLSLSLPPFLSLSLCYLCYVQLFVIYASWAAISPSICLTIRYLYI